MNQKIYWGVFLLAQVIGTLGVLTGSPHGNPFGLIAAMIFLFPGSTLGLFVLDKNLRTRMDLRSYRRFITISLGSVISSIAYRKPSRPKPESFTPP